ncbi:MAG TPA: ATP-dependent RNA helicase HrpA, partial [Pseudonocardiaceae bacterium]
RPDEEALRALEAEVAAAEERVRRRREAVPAVSFPETLPITARVDDIEAAISDHQVVIVAGETGSGKTTQLPKICLRLGRGVRGLIGHTQPRRLAARTVAERVAEELDAPGVVGHQIRFTDTSGERTLVKVMTDGILLAEIQHDRLLRRYDTLIIDEAHERSLNIDFILGYLARLLPRRPDLKVVITSATIDPERFARHFATGEVPAPIIEVSGRSYPVEVRYRPIVDPADPDADPDRDQVQAVIDAVRELSAEGPGDILVFLSGEREIRDTAEALSAVVAGTTEVLPLYARLSVAEQHRVFAPHPGRRVVLATNVAETSLTVPGIRYVVDAGTARISRYSSRRKVQRLPIEPVSRASATQRAGRCGRVADGICVRLYSEEDFESRPAFTEPEILRTNLASVILQMTALGLGDLAAFPFIDPPDRRNVTAGVQLLHELGALTGDRPPELTDVGRRLVRLPVDPRLGRMVLAAGDQGCVHEVMVVAAALSIQDPRERPVEHREAADARHARFTDPTSDFLAYLNLWRYLEEQQQALSGNQFRRLCRAEYLNYLRVREWQDVYGQLRQVARDLGLVVRPAVEPDGRAVHTALLAGLLSHIGLQDPETRDYLGARGTRFAIFPGSALFRRTPRWVMVAELVETTRLWGRGAARIEPEWIEPLAGHLVQRTYSEPRWDARRGAVLATERVTLYGVPIVVGRTVNYGRIDPALSRELFIRHALVEGDWETRHRFWTENRALIDEVRALEDRGRRRDILVGDDVLFDFYDRRVGAEVVSGRHFDTWWKRERRERPDLLTFTRELLVSAEAEDVTPASYPDEWNQGGGLTLPLSYHFEPGARDDGVSVRVPLPVLNQVDDARFSWQVPGLRAELVTALIRSLPKHLRRNLVPAPDVARRALERMPDPEATGESLLDALERALRELTGVVVPREAWRPDQVPDHLRITFRVVDAADRPLAEGKDLAALRGELHEQVRQALAEAATGIERSGIRAWDLGELPTVIERERSGFVVRSYPALVDEGDSVAVRVFDTPEEQRTAMRAGIRRLVLLNVPSPLRSVSGSLSNRAKLTLTRNPHGGVGALLDDCLAAAADDLIAAAGGPAWDGVAFDALAAAVRPELGAVLMEIVTTVERVLAAEQEARLRLAAAPVPPDALADLTTQLDALVHAGFVSGTGRRRLPHLVRYLRAVERRVEKLPENPARDHELMERVHALHAEYRALPPSPGRDEVRWMIEELRVSFFAQQLGTAQPVSERRIERAIDALLP